MRYRIHGANRKTGVETSMTVEAPTEDAAEAIALNTLTVYKVSEEPDRLDEAIAEEADHPAAQPPLPYAAPAPRPPSYDGIRVGAVILGIMAPALWIAGVIAFLVYFERQNEPGYLWMSASAFAYGAILWMLAAIGWAVRDIARNSFKQV